MSNPIIMGNPLLLVLDAGHGTTPACPEARYSKGQVIKRRAVKWLKDRPVLASIAAVVPPGFPPEHALADAFGQPRPLMVTAPKRSVYYVVAFDGDLRPALLAEKDIKCATGDVMKVGMTNDVGAP